MVDGKRSSKWGKTSAHPDSAITGIHAIKNIQQTIRHAAPSLLMPTSQARLKGQKDPRLRS